MDTIQYKNVTNPSDKVLIRPVKPNYSVIWHKEFVQVELLNRCTSEDILAAVFETITESGYFPGIPAIWDFTRADISDFDGDNIVQISEEIEDMLINLTPAKVAMLSERDLNMGLIYIFKEVFESKAINLEVFSEFTKAKDWITR